MVNERSPVPIPHDLLWGLAAAQLPLDAPAWVHGALSRHAPVVVRRALAEPGWIAVGVRGRVREERFATWMRLDQVRRRVSPEGVARTGRWLRHANGAWPALRALAWLAPQLDRAGLRWGVTGSLGFELASGLCAAHPASDLDLLIRVAQPVPRAWAGELCTLIDSAPGSIDVQLETPHGALALREWASGAARVLLKSNAGPLLVSDPWAAERSVA
ncbi:MULTISPECIES: malonate decarboxylase holo-ACP synthase [Pseudomonas]|uniref:Phosphoribosyl-dephospho-CoA transferase n=1 Tax=Pseudomonas fulva TaxID=47880 RepID=A0A0D0L1N6_9PSED|nr:MULTISPECIES: malonate decarboxylase holo-ACP synthase [Pseudomonas]KIQ06412.1 phosphoribosyl-dephospho-CoA transferase [Pseudomonas fulva]